MKMFLISIILCSMAFGTQAYTNHKTKLIDLLNDLSNKHQLVLSYSSDLVGLNDSIETMSTINLDSCIQQIEEQADIKIFVQDGYLVLTPVQKKWINIQGSVIDAETQEPLPYANILIKEAGIGTITNKYGQFDFKILDNLAGFRITFSFIGYSNSYFLINHYSQDDLVIEMAPKPYLLNDINVLPDKAIDIIKHAVRNIKRNYQRKRTQMEAFYRNTNYHDTTATQLIEAALLIEDRGIAFPIKTSKIELQQFRKSKNYQVPMDKRHETAWKTMEHYFGGHRNMLYKAYELNWVRRYKDNWGINPLTEYHEYNYALEDIEWLDSVRVYKIRYSGNSNDSKSVSESERFIYINSEDYAIIKIESRSRFIGKASIYNDGNGYFSEDEMAYQKINDKYYLKYVKSHTIPNGDLLVYDNSNDSKKEEKIVGKQWAEHILLITNIYASKKEFDRIKHREKMSIDENSYKITYDYHPEFWKTYNVLKENPVEEHLINELEWEESLDEQFNENSTNHVKD